MGAKETPKLLWPSLLARKKPAFQGCSWLWVTSHTQDPKPPFLIGSCF